MLQSQVPTMRCCWIWVLLTLAQAHAKAALAADVTFQPLASITNDRNAELQHVGVLLDAGEVVGLRFDTINGNNSHVSDFSIDDIKAGAVLDGDAKRKAIVLQGFIYSGDNANLVITYLSNGLSRKHKVCYARIERDASGQWHILDIYEHKWVDHLVIKTRPLGIATIQGICPG